MRSVIRALAERMLVRAPQRTHRDDRLVLAYHNVIPGGQAPRGDRSLHLPEEDFTQQLKFLRENTDVVPLQTLLDAPLGSQVGNRLVAITFDDAYASAMRIALAGCDAHGMGATVFVAPALLGTVPIWDRLALRGQWGERERERYLWELQGRATLSDEHGALGGDPHELRIASAEELSTALRSGRHDVANHTFDHVNLGALPPDESLDQVTRAASWLHERFPDRYVPIVSYPYGISPTASIDTLPRHVATHGMLASGGWMRPATSLEPFRLPRWNVPSGISIHGFRLRLRGWFSDR